MIGSETHFGFQFALCSLITYQVVAFMEEECEGSALSHEHISDDVGIDLPEVEPARFIHREGVHPPSPSLIIIL